MLDHIQNVRQAVRYAASDMKGEELPGFSIPKKVGLHSYVVPLKITTYMYVINIQIDECVLFVYLSLFVHGML